MPIPAIAFVFGWLLLVGWRQRGPELSSVGWFNLRQLALVGFTLVALIILGASVYAGLLGHPEMQLQGNGSAGGVLRWFEDRTDSKSPMAWVFSCRCSSTGGPCLPGRCGWRWPCWAGSSGAGEAFSSGGLAEARAAGRAGQTLSFGATGFADVSVRVHHADR